MNKITKKILAGILSLAMVFGCFGGIGTLDVKAMGDTLKLKVIDKNTKQPLEGVKFYLQYGKNAEDRPTENDISLDASDQGGNITYTLEGNEAYEDNVYYICLVAGSPYVLEKNIVVELDDPYEEGLEISKVDGKMHMYSTITTIEVTNSSVTETDPKQILKVNTKEGEENVSGVTLSLYDENGEETTLGKTVNGSIGYTLTEDAVAGNYTLGVASTEQKYVCNPIPVVLVDENGKVVISAVGNAPYTGETSIPFAVESIKIESVTAEPTTVPKEGSDNITLTVKGTNLPNTLYYRRYNRSSMDTIVGGVEMVEAKEGTDKERKITVSLPEAASGQNGWKIKVYVDAECSGENPVTIAVVEGATKEQLQAAIEKAEVTGIGENKVERKEEDYGPDSWAVYSKALADAKALLENESATGLDYQEAITALENAVKALRMIPSDEKVQIFKINVLDEAGIPISAEAQSNLKFQLVNNDNKGIVYDAAINDGIITVNADPVTEAGYYMVSLKDDSRYSCVQTISIQFAMGGISKKMFVKRVLIGANNVLDLINPETDLNIKEADLTPQVTGVETDVTAVKNKGQVTVKVKGKNLQNLNQNKLYYKLYYVEKTGDFDKPFTKDETRIPVDAVDSGDGKTITVALPEKPVGAYAWKVKVGALEAGDIMHSTGEIRIIEDVTKDDLQAIIDAYNDRDFRNYVDATWKVYSAAIEKGKTVIEKADADDLEYAIAYTDIKAAEDGLVVTEGRTAIRIKAVDEEGNPVSKLIFQIDTLVPRYSTETNSEGMATYTMDGGEKNVGGNIILATYLDFDYICDIPMYVEFYAANTNSLDYYVKQFTVNGKSIPSGEVATVTVKKKPEAGTLEKLDEAFSEAEQLKKEDYTPESWKVYEDAVEAAKAYIKSSKATETGCKEALEALDSAKTALVKKPDETPATPNTPETPATPAVTPPSPVQTGTTETTSKGTFEVTNPSKKTVTYKASSKSAKKVSIPSAVTIHGVSYKVTKIDNNAFAGSKKLTKVTIPASVTEIGASAFKNCTKLTSVTIPKNIKKIGKNAFAGCKKIKKITIRSGKIKTIGKNAFKGLSKKTVIKVPKKKKAAYKKMFKRAGFKGRVK